MQYFSILCFVIVFIIFSLCGFMYIIDNWTSICDRLTNVGLIFFVLSLISGFIHLVEEEYK